MQMKIKNNCIFLRSQASLPVRFSFPSNVRQSTHRPIGNTNSCLISTVFTDVSLTKPEGSLILEGDSLFCAWDQEICDLQQINATSDS